MAEHTIHPSIASEILALTGAIRQHLGDRLARIVLYGSAIRDDFRPDSDIDLAIMLSGDTQWCYADRYSLRNTLRPAISETTDDRLRLDTRPLAEFERLANFPLCYDGQVMRGLVLHDSGLDLRSARLAPDVAKREVIDKIAAQANDWLDTARALDAAEFCYQTLSLRERNLLALWERARACCRALHAVWLWHNLDQSPKQYRWNLSALHARAAEIAPALQSLMPALATFPAALALLDRYAIWEMTHNDAANPFDLSSHASALAAQAASRCVAQCIVLVNYEPHPAPKHRAPA